MSAHRSGCPNLTIGLKPLWNKRKQLLKTEHLTTGTTRLHSQAAKARPLAQQVALNLALQRVQAELAQVRSHL